MNGIRCRQCSVINSPSAVECRQCRFPFGNLSSSDFVTVPEGNVFTPQNPATFAASPVSQTGRKTYFWYRMYCSALVVLYSVMAVIGIVAIIGSYGADAQKPQDAFNGGVFLLVLGAILAIIYLIGVVLAPKPGSWILGIVLIALGMTSICFLPLTLPLLFFWLKPETQTYFGRRK